MKPTRDIAEPAATLAAPPSSTAPTVARASESNAGDTLAAADTQLPATSLPGGIDATAAAVDGAFGDRYEARKLLGAGGMGEVRLYKDRRIGREIALKSLRSGSGTTGSTLGRFMQEARVQGQLEHPAVVPVYDLGQGPDGAVYFTMKRVRGMTLADIVEALAAGDTALAARYSRRKLLAAFASLCLAVDFAHSRGVIHRDLKPANVMLGDFGEVHLLDWGVAKLVGAADVALDDRLDVGAAGPAHGTVHGALIGTPGYMAPEQCRGEVDALDARADVYALGAVLFELLALAPLHPAPSMEERLLSTLTGVDGRPSWRAPGADVPPELDDVCARATAQEPAARYPSARALCDAVERYLDGDRDVQRRRQLAAAHTEAAMAATTRAQGTSGGASGAADRRAARTAAMQDVLRALALDPDQPAAAGLLARLMMDVPDEMPPAAQAEMEAAGAPGRRAAAFVTTHRGAMMLPLVLVLSLLGVRSWAMVGLIVGLMLAASAASLYWWRGFDTVPAWFGYVPFVLSTAAIGAMSGFVGSMMIVPLLALLNAALFIFQSDFRIGRSSVLIVALTVAGPYVLQALGVFPEVYAFRGNELVVRAQAIDLHPGLAGPFLVLVTTLAASLPLVLLLRARRALAATDRRLFLHSWHLRQLLPAAEPPRAPAAPG